MFKWDIEAQLKRHQVRNAHDLAMRAGLSYPVATRVWANTPSGRLDAETLRKLATFFGTARPLTLVRLED